MGGNHDGLETTGADLVNCRRVTALAEASTNGDLARGRLTNAGLHDVAHVDLLDRRWRDSAGLERMLEGDDTKLGCSESLEGTVEGADWGTRGSDDHNFMGSGGLLQAT